MTRAPAERFAQFRAFHRERLLVLANCWDALSARLVEETGAAAVATGSAALAWALGHRDGEQLPLARLVDAVRGIARNLTVPLSVDLERGYGSEPARVADAVAQVIDAGAVGVNLEDGAGSATLLADKLRAVRARSGPDVFLNARTCIVLHDKVAPDDTVREVLARAKLFEEAGADGLFVPRLTDEAAIAAIARGTSLPLNVFLVPGLPPPPRLHELGVRRLSIGPRLALAAYTVAREAARVLQEQGSYDALLHPGLVPFADANRLFSEPA